MKSLLLISPFLLQNAIMIVDEFYFHYQRGLPRWERIGHPLDTLTILSCFSWILFIPPHPFSTKVYLSLAIFSCLFVTKDEWVHIRFCRPGENWIHAILFMLHPLLLISAFLIWPLLHSTEPSILKIFFYGQFSLTILFLIYQILYWNFLWKEQPKSTIASTTI